MVVSSRARRLRAALAAAAALGVAVVLGLVGTSPGVAAGTVSTGVIQGTSPLARIYLNASGSQQVFHSTIAPTQGGFYHPSDIDPVSSYNLLFEGDSTTSAQLAAPTRTFGGAGTTADPFFLQNQSTTTADPAGVEVTDRLSYVDGDSFYRNDVTLRNTTAADTSLSFYRYGDCFLGGSDEGTSSIPVTSAECQGVGTALALVPVTPGASMQTGFYFGIEIAVNGNQLTNECDDSGFSPLSEAECETIPQDNAIAVGWPNQNVPAGGSITLSYLTSYSLTAPNIADLAPTVSPGTADALVGDTFTYQLSVTNNGPDSALATALTAPMSPLATFVSASGNGSYNPATGIWAVGTLANEATATMTVTVRASAVGAAQLGVTNVSSASLDSTPCTLGNTDNCGAQPTVAIRSLSTVLSDYAVSTGSRAADGSDSHTVTVHLSATDGTALTGLAARLDLVASPSAGVGLPSFTETATPGEYSALVASTSAGGKAITARVSIDGSPVALPLASAGNGTALFVAGEPEAGQSSVSIDDADPRVADGSQVHQITVTLHDANANPVSGAAAGLVATVAPGVSVQAFTEAATPGVYTAAVTSTVAGSQPVIVQYGPTTVGAVAANFVAGPVSLANSLIELVTPGNRTVGDPATVIASDTANVHLVRVTARDAFDNQVAGAPVEFALPANLLPVQGASTDASTAPDGTAVLAVTTSSAGSYPVAATVAGGTVANGSPAVANFVPDVPAFGPGQTRLTVTAGAVEANGLAQHAATVSVTDQFGNPVAGVAVTIVLPTGVNAGGAVSGTSDAAGEFSIPLTSTIAGSYQVGATVNGISLTPTVTVVFAAGAPSAATSTFVTSPAGPIAAGGQYTGSVTLRDAASNAVANAPVTFDTPAGLSLVEPGPYVTDAVGQVVVHFTATVAGVYDAEADTGGDQIGATQALAFVAGPPDTANVGTTIARTTSTLTVTADGIAAHEITATVVDEFGNPVAGANVDFALPPGVAVAGGGSTTVATDASGRAIISLVSTVAGTSDVTATVGGAPIVTGSPVEVRFEAGPVSPTLSELVIAPAGPLTVGEGAASTYTATVHVVDSFGNPIAGEQVTLESMPLLTQSSTGGVTDVSGNVVVTMTSLLSGTFEITASAQGAPIGSPSAQQRVYVAGAPDIAPDGQSTLTATTGAKIANGTDVHTSTATVKDSFGNPIAGQSVAFAQPANLSAPGGSVATTGPDGIASIDVTSTVEGLYPISAYLGATPGDPSFLIANGDPVAVQFVAGPVDSAASTLAVTSSTAAPLAVGTGPESTFTATARVTDAQGNPIVGAGVSFALQDSGGAATGGQPALSENLVVTDADGVATVTITSTLAGTFAVVASVAGVAVSGSPAALAWHPGPVAAVSSVLDLTTGTQPADGVATHTATLTARDSFGNVVTDPVAFVLSVASPATGSGTVTTDSAGTVSVPITSTVAGTFAVGATLDGVDVSSGPGSVTFGPSVASPTASTIIAAPASIVADGVSTSVVTARLVDAFGNALDISGGVVTMSTSAGSLGPVVDNGDGTYTATLTSATVAGQATVSFTVNGVAANKTAPVALVPGAVDASASSIGAAASVLEANGTATTTVTVTLRDAHGNPLGASGGPVTMSTTAGTLGPVTDNGDGTYVATLTAPTAVGEATVSFTVNGAASSSTVTVAFVADVASPEQSLITAAPTSIAADGVSTSAVTVTLVDALGNTLGVSGGPVTMSTSAGLLGPVTDNGDGTYTTTLTSATVAGSATVSFIVNGATATHTATVAFVPGAVDAGVSTIGASAASLEANGVATTTITVTLRDAQGNALGVGGSNVAITTTAGTLGPVTDNGDGTYGALLTSSTVAEDATVGFAVDGVPSSRNLLVTFVPGAPSAARSRIDATPTAIVADGVSTSAVTVTLVDAFDNPLGASGGTVTMSTSAGSLGAVTDNGDGTYTATLTSATVAGLATVAFAIDGAPAANQVQVTFTPGVAAQETSAIVATPTTLAANSGATSTVTVTLLDAHGNRLTVGGASVAMSTTSGSLSAVSDHGDGTYTAVLTAGPPGRATLSFTVGGVTAAASAAVDFVPGLPDLSRSTIGAAPTTIEADGTSTSTVTVTVVDGVGNPVPGAAVAVTATAGIVGPVTDHGNGTYTATLTSATVAGAAVIGFSVGESPSPNTVDVTFTDTTAPLKPAITGPAGPTTTSTPTFEGTGEPGASLEVRDAGGNALCSTVVAPDGTWSCTPTTPLPLGPAQFTAVQTDPSGNVSEAAVSLDRVIVGPLAIEVADTQVVQGGTTSVTGRGFVPGEQVAGVVNSAPLLLGTMPAGADGSVTFRVDIPKDFELGAHGVTLTGVWSGPITGALTVVAAPVPSPSASPSASASSGQPAPSGQPAASRAALVTFPIIGVLARTGVDAMLLGLCAALLLLGGLAAALAGRRRHRS